MIAAVDDRLSVILDSRMTAIGATPPPRCAEANGRFPPRADLRCRGTKRYLRELQEAIGLGQREWVRDNLDRRFQRLDPLVTIRFMFRLPRGDENDGE